MVPSFTESEDGAMLRNVVINKMDVWQFAIYIYTYCNAIIRLTASSVMKHFNIVA